MFRFNPPACRIAFLQVQNSPRFIRSFHGTFSRDIRAKFQPIKELPQTSEELEKCLQKVYMGVSRGNRRQQADNKRVNILSKQLCDDILDRMKPSLLKHTGCDIIDVNPGAGVWSSAVHDLLKPRNHYLLEPDHELYRPLLQPLLDEKDSTYKFLPKSGVVWGHLTSILTPENLPQQVEYKEGDPRLDEPNDTLLFMANLGWSPRKPFRGFPSISLLVIHQLLSAARAHSLFHRYGLVRMLIWVADEEGKSIIPRTIQLRRKMAIEAEMSCSNIFEIASSNSENTRWRREEYYNLESSRAVLKRMEDAGVTTPDGRTGPIQLEASKTPQVRDPEDDLFVRRDFHAELDDLEKLLAVASGGKRTGDKPKKSDLYTPEYKRFKYLTNYKNAARRAGKAIGAKSAADLEELESNFASGKLRKCLEPVINEASGNRKALSKATSSNMVPEHRQLKYLRSRVSADRKKGARYIPLFQEFDTITKLQKAIKSLDGAAAERMKQEIEERTTAWNDGVENLTRFDLDSFHLQLDSRKTFRNEPPLLAWDRREAEPLTVHRDEFFPKSQLCLLDFHPQPIWPILRQGFPATYDIFEYIMSTLFMAPTQSVRHGLTMLYPGAFEWLIEECPSITDVSKNGNPNVNLMTVRCLTLEMFKEIIEAWMRWPFRPDRYELISRMGSVVYDPDNETPIEK